MKDENVGYEIEVSRLLKEPLVKLLRRHGLNDEAKEADEAVETFGTRVIKLAIGDWPIKLLEEMVTLLVDERRARSYVKAYLKIRQNPATGKVRKLALLPEAMYHYLATGAIDGWIYEEVTDGYHIAWVVDSIEYTSRDDYHNRPEHVTIHIKANRARFEGEEERSHHDGIQKDSITLFRDAIAGRQATAASILLKAGYLRETKELKEQYLKELELFQKFRPQEGKQFTGIKTALEAEGGYWWSRSDKQYTLPHATRMVNEEGVLNRKITLECYQGSWKSYGIKDKQFGIMPLHPFVLMFDLTRHEHVWLHVNNLVPYKYQPSLRDKLVLPTVHRDLIDVLTEDMDVFVEDIIEGKSGGTAILCYGAPGLGKTLTAEVYSEVVRRPLYRVHAGQLGTDVESVEATLEKCLRRAERWGAVMLLDEADVYIRQRGNDMHHNAVVAAFLRTLEYFHGLLFLTTNRIADVDDAIASRMVATFKYEIPDKQQATAIWSILSKQFGITLSDKLIGQLTEKFKEASGRDIKQLLKLTMKYCSRKGKKMDIEAFRVCAMFRGVS